MVDEFAPPKFFASAHGMEHDQLFIEFNVEAASQMSLSAKERMCTEYNIKKKRRLKSVVHELYVSSSELKGKLSNYENLTEWLEEFQDAQLKVINDKFDKLYTDFIEMSLHLEERFYSHLLTIIAGRRWLLTYGMEMDVFIPLAEPFSAAAVTGTKVTSSTVPATVDTTATLSITFASASIVDPISIDDYEVTGTVTGKNVADGNVSPFSNVDDAELNIP
nr:hypothetical protein [Tanacetum cinerariifolium]